LEHYGFIYKRDTRPDGSKSDQFFPTHLATSLTSGAATTLESGDEKKFLILETNYKIYAYTCELWLALERIEANEIANELEIAILNLFVNIKIRYKNLVVGKLDRQHVKAAMEKGISANQVSSLGQVIVLQLTGQIISYLSSHAHQQMYLSPPPLLHPTITDQLHLWDKERNRLKIDECKLLPPSLLSHD
jgi:transcription initiation factor TFIIH subunit 4